MRKILLLGPSGGGKTALRLAATGRPPADAPTVGLHFTVCHQHNTVIWECGGNPRHTPPLASVLAHRTDALLLVYDATSPASFALLVADWLAVALCVAARAPCPLFVVANKCDVVTAPHQPNTHLLMRLGARGIIRTTARSAAAARSLFWGTVALFLLPPSSS